MRNPWEWYVVSGEPTVESVLKSRAPLLVTRWKLPTAMRTLRPDDTLDWPDAGPGGWLPPTRPRMVRLMCRRLIGQGAGVTALTPLPRLACGLLGEIVSIGVCPAGPTSSYGRWPHVDTLGLRPADGGFGFLWPHIGGKDFTPDFAMLPYGGQAPKSSPADEPAAGLVAGAGSYPSMLRTPKIGDGPSWHLVVRTDKRSAPYVVLLTVMLFSRAEIEALRPVAVE